MNEKNVKFSQHMDHSAPELRAIGHLGALTQTTFRYF